MKQFFPSFFNIDIGVEQNSILSPILLALYLSPIFHIFERQTKNLKIPISFLSFINNKLFILQEKPFEKTNSFYFVIIISFSHSSNSLDLEREIA